MTDLRKNERKDELLDGPTDSASYSDARTPLKSEVERLCFGFSLTES